MLDKYHFFSAETSDGKERVEGYAHSQMLKFILGWLMVQEYNSKDGTSKVVPKKAEDGTPVTVKITHEYREYDIAEEAKAKGLRLVFVDANGNPKPGQEKPYEKYYGVKADPKAKWPGYSIVELEAPRTLTLEEQEAEADKEAAAAAAAAKAATEKAATVRAAVTKAKGTKKASTITA